MKIIVSAAGWLLFAVSAAWIFILTNPLRPETLELVCSYTLYTEFSQFSRDELKEFSIDLESSALINYKSEWGDNSAQAVEVWPALITIRDEEASTNDHFMWKISRADGKLLGDAFSHFYGSTSFNGSCSKAAF